MWESSTGGYGLIYIQKASEGVYYVLSMPKLGSKTGTWKVIQQWKTLAQAKAGGEEFAQRVHASKGKSLGTIMSNPRNTTVTKKKRRSAAQILGLHSKLPSPTPDLSHVATGTIYTT